MGIINRKRRYRAMPQVVVAPQAHTRYDDPARIKKDTTRGHAINWMIGISVLVFGVLLAAWFVVNGFSEWTGDWDPVPVSVIFTIALPLALLAGAVAGAAKLIKFTEEYRDYLYTLEEAFGLDIDGDGAVGDPAPSLPQAGERQPGALILGPDGARHRVDVELTMFELSALKKYLLTEHTCSVRGLLNIVGGERASMLRTELHRIGILGKLHNNRPTPLTEGGIKAVRRWVVSSAR